jgi:L-threonylcarbamoyladenylate synthase
MLHLFHSSLISVSYLFKRFALASCYICNLQRLDDLMYPGRHTEVIQVDPARPDPAVILYAAKLLSVGGLVVFPTETVYGLGADAFQPPALRRIFVAKGRPFSDPLIVHIADQASLEVLTAFIPDQAKRLAAAFWPGPLTLVLPRGKRVPSLVTAGLKTVAVRMPRHPVALALIRALGSPIAAPSANRFMHVSPTTAGHVLADLDGRVPLILDGGPCEVGVESTVLNLCSDTPTILRPGGVSLEELRAVLPVVQPPPVVPALANVAGGSEVTEARGGLGQQEQSQLAPGQLPMHYAPAVPLLLFDGLAQAVRAAMLAEVQRRRAQGVSVGVLVGDEDLSAFRESGALVQSLGDAGNPAQIAKNLFAGLRSLEDAHAQVILCRSFDGSGLGLAIRDRLLKAAGGRVMRV